MKASEYLTEILKTSKFFEETETKLVATEIVKNQKITSICENTSEDKLWSSNIKTIEYAR